ncbi:hypothetical protein ACWF62_14315 [Rhodococcus sp. NPDC054953]
MPSPDQTSTRKPLPLACLCALALITFTAPWVSYEPGVLSSRAPVHVALGGKVTAEDMPMAALQGQAWGLVFAGVCLAFAVGIASQTTAGDVGGVTFLAGGSLFLLVLATWLGRSVWTEVPLDDPSMAWGYWVSLALTIVLTVGGLLLCPADSD